MLTVVNITLIANSFEQSVCVWASTNIITLDVFESFLTLGADTRLLAVLAPCDIAFNTSFVINFLSFQAGACSIAVLQGKGIITFSTDVRLCAVLAVVDFTSHADILILDCI